MAEVYLLVAVHLFVVIMVCGSFAYQFHRMYVENKIAEQEIKNCEYRTEHLNAERLKGIINK